MTEQANTPQSKPRSICRFYQTAKGCRAGEACPYRHEKLDPSSADSTASAQAKQRQAPLVDRSKVVQKPQPAVEDARTFQVGQIQRRFRITPTPYDRGERFVFDLMPSDPDFPYDLDALHCQLDVPFSYRQNGSATLKVVNKEIPRGFQINIERGFASLARQNPEATLLGLLNRLDKQLESILSGEEAETIKIIVNKQATAAPPAQPTPVASITAQADSAPVWTPTQKAEARNRRDAETRQLEARFGRLPAFVKSSDELRFSLPLESPKKSSWPAPLQVLKVCTLIVPDLYPLEPPALVLDGYSIEARNVSQAFTDKVTSNKALTLTQLVNFLLVNMKDMSTSRVSESIQSITRPEPATTQPTPVAAAADAITDPDRPHIMHISRPPEWNVDYDEDSSSDSEDDDLHDSSTASGSEEEPGAQAYTSAPIERGVLLSFPQLDMHGIELLELTLLSLTVKCTRCKETTDVERIRNTITDGSTTAAEPRSESCRKCAQSMTIGFRADLMHASSVRAGYLDLDGCTPADILPSSFTPNCSECSTPHPSIVAVRAETSMAICRTCHRKMTLRIQEERFLRIDAIRTSRLPARKKEKEKLGIVAGTELPRRGRCSHYGKSYRWFRFSCCNKVYACDRCHDEEQEHPNEHANRMICGYCSREQNYRPEDCGICHAVLIGKKGHGFWEGGKGTRDKARMSRKDPRKYKRIGGGQPKKS